jgi:hypothetical protein
MKRINSQHSSYSLGNERISKIKKKVKTMDESDDESPDEKAKKSVVPIVHELNSKSELLLKAECKDLEKNNVSKEKLKSF